MKKARFASIGITNHKKLEQKVCIVRKPPTCAAPYDSDIEIGGSSGLELELIKVIFIFEFQNGDFWHSNYFHTDFELLSFLFCSHSKWPLARKGVHVFLRATKYPGF